MCKSLYSLTVLAIVAGVVLASATPTAAQGGCQVVHRPYATATEDGGLTFVPYHGMPITDYSITWGLAATGVPELLYMHAANTLWVSEDDGCNWSEFGTTAFSLYRITAGSGATAYAWPENGGSTVYRLEPSDKNMVGYAAFGFVAPESSLLGLGVDANDPLHIRVVGRTGQIYESFLGGAGWAPIGEPANPDAVVSYFAAFDPHDLDHVVFGQPLDGGYVTFDGGQSWDRSLFFSDESSGQGTPPGQASDRVNFFVAVISPVNSDVVYGRAIDLEESEAGDPTFGRHVYVSDDGGRSFVPVIDDVDGVPLPTQPLMVADRDDSNKILLVRSGRPQFGGTTFFAYDRSTNTVIATTNATIPIVRSLAISIANPARMIVGFEIVR